MAALNFFTPQASAKFVALGVAKAFLLPAGSTPTTLVLTNEGPETVSVALTTATASTTATAAAGVSVITVASNTGILVGQNVIGVGLVDAVVIPINGNSTYPNSAPTTTVVSINGTAITISTPTVGRLSSTAVVFVNPLDKSAGMDLLPGNVPLVLALASNTYLQAICTNFYSSSLLNATVGV